jgi:ech hydrogenase subunit A
MPFDLLNQFNLVLFLIGFPVAGALILLLFKNATIRTVLLKVFAAVVIIATIAMTVISLNAKAIYFDFELPFLEYFILAIEALMLLWVLIQSIKHKKIGTLVVTLIQAGLMTFFQINYGQSLKLHNTLFVDQFTMIMVIIIGVIGSMICIYAIGYMKDYHNHHKEMKDKRNVFAFFLLAFLGAMFGIVFSNNIMWLNFFWEVTSFCSFILIGYSKTEEAINNAFRAVFMNFIGGAVFTAGFIYLYANTGILELDKLLVLAKSGNHIGIVVCLCLCFAGMVKSAQFPFSTWLLGAMVAPTPVSALLHSSTMVKAGVYLVVRVAPVLVGTIGGYSIALIGGLTFLFGSLLAISQSNAKKVLAYSTICNLGLIVACAGIGQPEAIVAAIFLIIFHAVSKSLLFLCVGTVEHKIGSRDIEDMDWLIIRMPVIAIAMVIGIAGMVLPPFGMLISKWLVIGAFVDAHSILSPVLLLTIAFGSVLNILFWVKWLGKIVATIKYQKPIKKTIYLEETIIIWTLAILTILTCLVLPLISKYFIEPYLQIDSFTKGFSSNFVILFVMILMILILPLSLLFFGKGSKSVKPYLSGRNSTDELRFDASMGKTMGISLKNYYFANIIKENKFLRIGEVCAYILLVIIIIGSII